MALAGEIAFNGKGLGACKNLKNKYMEPNTIEDILNKYVIEAPSMGRSVILADRIDEVADDIRQFYCAKPLVSGRSEQLCGTCTEFKIEGKMFVCKKCGKKHKSLSA